MGSKEVVPDRPSKTCDSRAEVKVGGGDKTRADLTQGVSELGAGLEVLVSNIFSVLHVDRILLLLHQLPLGALAVLLGPALGVQVELISRESLHLKTI